MKREYNIYWTSNQNVTTVDNCIWNVKPSIVNGSRSTLSLEYYQYIIINSWHDCSRQDPNRDGLVSFTFDSYYPITVASLLKTECSLCADVITQQTLIAQNWLADNHRYIFKFHWISKTKFSCRIQWPSNITTKMVKSIYDLGYDWDVLRNKHDMFDIPKWTTIHNNSSV